jgi:CRP/FNR family cyclic AMP-dependent transcriptional regulator
VTARTRATGGGAFVGRALRIRPGEGRVVAILVGLAFVSLAGITIGESGISAVFFERIGPRSLPVMYLIQAAVAFATMLALSGWLARLGSRRAYLLAPVALACVLILERAIAFGGARWVYAAMWVTVAVGTLVQGVFAWGVAGAVVDARQAKRVFPIAAAGGILGAVAGGVATRFLADALGAINLVLIWAAALALAAGLVRLALGPPVRQRSRRRVARRRTSAVGEVARGLSYVRRSRLLVWMTVAAVLFSVLFYSLYLPFAQAASERYRDTDELAGFLGLFGAALTGGAFVISVILANRLFVRIGVARLAVALPVLYGVGFAVVLLDARLATLVAVRLVVGVWLQGVASPGWETLLNVVPDSRRDQTRAFINGGPTQVGTAIAGLAALVGRQALSVQQLAWIGLAAALLTAAVALAIRRSYADALLDALRAGRPRVFDVAASPTAPTRAGLDRAAEDVLARSLASEDQNVRRLAFEVLSDAGDGDRRDELRGAVRDDDPMVRASVARALDPVTDRRALIEMMRDGDPRVASTAAARMLPSDREGATTTLGRLLADDDADVRAAAAAAITDARARGEPAAAELVVPSLADPDSRVRVAAGRALGASGILGLDRILAVLADARSADAGVAAITMLEERPEAGAILEVVRSWSARAAADRDAAAAIPDDDPATSLLRDALLERGRRSARAGLWALSTIVGNRTAVEAAIESLDARDPIQLANALETLEASGDRTVVGPLLSLWEPLSPPAAGDDAWRAALRDPDDLIRRSAELARLKQDGDAMPTQPPAELSLLERLIRLRSVPLFADLAPSDLERVAAVSEERTYADGETIAAEGELGEEMHVVVEGVVRVVQDREGGERELARRGEGDVIGEMSILARQARVASLVAAGQARTVSIGRREFESILRERPEVGLAVMRVLAQRLGEESLR